MSTSVFTRIDAWLFAPGPADRVARLRVGLAGVLFLRIVTWPFHELAGTPAALFRAPPLLSWTGGFPPSVVFVGLQVVGAFGAVWTVVATRRHGSAWFPLTLTWVSLLVLGGYKTSTGKVLHNDVLVLLVAAPVMLCGVRARLGDRTVSPAFGWPHRAALVTLASVYFLCGVQKLRHTGPEWVFSDNMRWILDGAISSGLAPTTVISAAIASSAVWSMAAAAGLVGLELAFPAVLVWTRVRPFFAAAAVALHTFTWLTLGLDYWAWSLTAALVLGLGSAGPRSLRRRPPTGVAPATGTATPGG